MELARQAAADGIAVVCATPHIRHDHDVRIAEIAERCRELDLALAQREIPVAVAPGGEVSESALERLDETELRLVSLNGTGRWVLLEPRPGPLTTHLASAVGHLAQRGARCIVAHPERHIGEDFFERLEELVEAGALIQITADLVLRDGSGPALEDLVVRGLAHLVASDAHTARWGRPLRITEAIARLERCAGPTVGQFLREAPARILRGEDVEPPQPPGV